MPACYASCTVYCVSRGGLDKVYIKVDMVERRKTLEIWFKRRRDNGVVEGTRLEAKDTKKYPRPKTALSRTPFLGQGHKRKCSPKKDSNNTFFKIFFHAF